MPPVLKVNGYDLSGYLRMHHEEGYDPVDAEKVEPQFSGTPAFREGQEWVGDAVGNRQWTVPLTLDAGSRSGLHELIRTINSQLNPGAEVEFATDSADEHSFFTLERGILDPKYEYFLSVHALNRAMLRLWTRPFARTATMRTIASFVSTGPQHFQATGIFGDVAALANLEIKTGSMIASPGRVIGYGVHRSASFYGVHQANFMVEKQPSSLSTGASGAIASLMVSYAGGATGATGFLCRNTFLPRTSFIGRHRVFGVLRSNLDIPPAIYAKDRFGAVLGPTRLATVNESGKWQLMDLGEISIPEGVEGQALVPTQYLELYGGGASGAGFVNASGYFLSITGMLVLPLDISPGLLVTPGVARELLFYDDFSRVKKSQHGFAEPLFMRPIAVPGPGIWAGFNFTNWLGGQLNAGGGVTPLNAFGFPAFGASAVSQIGSGALLKNVLAETKFNLTHFITASQVASGASIELYPKMTTPTQGFAVRVVVGPSANNHIAIVDYAAAGATARASAPLGGSTASGIHLSQLYRLAVEVEGGAVSAWLATGAPVTPILTASHANFTQPGWPGLKLINGAATTLGGATTGYFTGIAAHSIKAWKTGGSPIDIHPFESFRFESYPEGRAFQGNASILAIDRSVEFRGAFPRLPVTGSAMPSGPCRVFAFHGAIDDFACNDLIGIELSVQDRFQFLR